MTHRGRPIDYSALALFRFELRKFLAFSENAAAAAQLTGPQHQALLAIHGLSQTGQMSVGELADILLLRHHSAVELVDRLSKLGLVHRSADPDDGRRVLIGLTPEGLKRLHSLSAAHIRELETLAPALTKALRSWNDINS